MLAMKRKVKKIPVLLTFIILIGMVFGCLYFFKEYFKKEIKIEKPTELEKEEIKRYEGSMTVAGNVLINSNMWSDTMNANGTYDFDYVFDGIKDKVKASNVNIYSQQSILGGKALKESLNSNYNSPTDVFDSLNKLGFNAVSLASYQSFDKGLTGINNTIDYITNKNSIYSGISNSEENRLKNNISTKSGIRYGLLSYTIGTDTTLTNPYLVNVYTDDLAKRDIEAIKNNVDILIVSIDWSNINSYEITQEQSRIANYLSGLGVNVIIGNTGYSIQPIEIIGNTIVFYSVGNLLSGHTSIDSRISLISDFKIKITDKEKVRTIEFTDINVSLLFAYNQFKTNYKVIPFNKITTELPSYSTYYEKYNKVLTDNKDYINVYKLGE
jgi:poly-gamma-glutamate synthesis protein (capsule biosynthesis protein)